jgi:hypothetical protein
VVCDATSIGLCPKQLEKRMDGNSIHCLLNVTAFGFLGLRDYAEAETALRSMMKRNNRKDSTDSAR